MHLLFLPQKFIFRGTSTQILKKKNTLPFKAQGEISNESFSLFSHFKDKFLNFEFAEINRIFFTVAYIRNFKRKLQLIFEAWGNWGGGDVLAPTWGEGGGMGSEAISPGKSQKKTPLPNFMESYQ